MGIRNFEKCQWIVYHPLQSSALVKCTCAIRHKVVAYLMDNVCLKFKYHFMKNCWWNNIFLEIRNRAKSSFTFRSKKEDDMKNEKKKPKATSRRIMCYNMYDIILLLIRKIQITNIHERQEFSTFSTRKYQLWGISYYSNYKHFFVSFGSLWLLQTMLNISPTLRHTSNCGMQGNLLWTSSLYRWFIELVVVETTNFEAFFYLKRW